HATDVIHRIGATPKPARMVAEAEERPYSITPYQSTHCTGSVVMGTEPATSAVNRYLQSWNVPNLFVIGASAFPHNSAYDPTGTVGALAYWTTDTIRTRYLRQPGPLI